MIALKLCCDSSRDVAIATDFCSFNAHFFRRGDQCVINFVHSSTTRFTVVSVIHEVDLDDFF